jgi:PAS domain S-box-containing protein
VQDVTERRRSEEALRMSEKRFRSLFETSTDAILLVNQETGEIVAANPAACALYGYSAEEFLSLKDTDVSAEPKKTENAVKISATAVPFRLHRKKDGTVFPVEISGGYFQDGDTHLHTAFIRDISKRQKTEEDLLTYGFAIESSISGVGFADLDGSIRYVNDAFLRLWGYDSDDGVVGRQISEFALHGADEEAIKALRSGKSFVGEAQAKRKDGTAFVVEVSVNVVRTQEGTPVCLMAAFVDISDRKRAEAELAETKERLEIAQEAGRIGSFEWYIRTQTAHFGGAMEAIYGEKPGSFTGRYEGWRQRVCPEDRDRVERHFADVVRGNAFPHLQYRIVWADGSIHWIEARGKLICDERGQPLRVVGVNIDITDRVKAQDALRESEEKYRQFFGVENDALFLIDQGTGAILEVNDAACTLYGYSREEMLRMKNSDVSAEPEETVQKTKEFQARIAGRMHRKKDGTAFPVDIASSVFALKNRPVILASIRDITERIEAEKERQLLEERLQRLNKEESLGRMAGSIAHHYNNLLCAALGNLEIAEMDIPRGSNAGTYIANAIDASRRAADIGHLMLSYLGQGAGNREALDLAVACHEALHSLASSVPEGVHITTNLPSPDPAISGARSQVRDIVSNLLTNAIESVGQGGEITVTVDQIHRGEIGACSFNPPDWEPAEEAYARLTVTDTGVGIEPAIVGMIFDPFFSTKFLGRGLGLAVVLGIVKAHGGATTVQSSPGRGSTFSVFLPLSAVEPVTRESEKQKESWPSVRILTVLVVDDEPSVSHVAQVMLKRLGYEVVIAAGGRDAIEVLRRQPDGIDCVLCDLSMADMDGWETMAGLGRIRPDLPVILASGFTEAHALAGGHARPRSFLKKPYSLDGLREAVADACEKKG